DQVLEQMLELGWITPEQAAAARAEQIQAPVGRSAPPEAYFMEHVRRALDDHALDPARLGFGSEVFTTLDRRLQRIASEAVDAAGRRMDRGRPGRRGAHVAGVAIAPR